MQEQEQVAFVCSALERIHQIIIRAADLEEMLSGVLGAVLDIFDGDRAWVLVPCPQAPHGLRIEAEQGRAADGTVDAMNAGYAALYRTCLNAPGALHFDVEHPPFGADGSLTPLAGAGSILAMSLEPASEQVRVIGLQCCGTPKADEAQVTRLFSLIAHRIADGLMRHLVLAKLMHSEGRFQVLVEHAPEAIVLLDAQSGQFVDANPNAERLFRSARADLLKRGPADFSPMQQPGGQASHEMIKEHLSVVLEGGFPIFEWMHCDASGKQVECEVRLARLPGTFWIRGSITDISARKAAERERLELQMQLAQSQKLEALGQLTGGVAHDFNNLLTVIMGNLELLVDNPSDTNEVLEQASYIQAAADRAQALTHRLLAFARKQPLRPTSIDVRRLLHGMDELLRRTLGESIEIEVVVGGGLWPCEADAAQLESSILNLAINARDAMPSGGRLTLEASNARLDHEYAGRHQEVIPGQYVLLAVSDNGAGVPPELMDKIFAPFFTTKQIGRGSGLGLSMVFGFIKQSGGHIKAYSELGQGTTMKLYLPKATSMPVAPAPSSTPERVTVGNGERVLVVEDELAVLELTGRQLQQLGYRVLVASTAVEALLLLEREGPVDLLLTDVILTGGASGAELARDAQQRYPELAVLFMSGYTENSIIHNGRLDPGVELLEKPFGRSTLALRVRAALAAKRSR